MSPGRRLAGEDPADRQSTDGAGGMESRSSEHDRQRELAGAVAHAARGPYASALPALGMVLDGVLGALDPAQRDALETVDGALRRAFADSCDLTLLLGAELARSRFSPAPCAVGDLLEDVVVLAGPECAVRARLDVTPGLPPTCVDHDRTAVALALLVAHDLRVAPPSAVIGISARSSHRFGESPPSGLSGRGVLGPVAPDGRVADAAGGTDPVEVGDDAGGNEDIEVRIEVSDPAGLKLDDAAADYPVEGAGLTACRAIVAAQGGRLEIARRHPAVAGPQEPGSQGEEATVTVTVWLPAVSTCREGETT